MLIKCFSFFFSTGPARSAGAGAWTTWVRTHGARVTCATSGRATARSSWAKGTRATHSCCQRGTNKQLPSRWQPHQDQGAACPGKDTFCASQIYFFSKAAIYNQGFLFLAFENLHQVSDHSIWHVCHSDLGICLNLMEKQIFVLPLITI